MSCHPFYFVIGIDKTGLISILVFILFYFWILSNNLQFLRCVLFKNYKLCTSLHEELFQKYMKIACGFHMWSKGNKWNEIRIPLNDETKCTRIMKRVEEKKCMLFSLENILRVFKCLCLFLVYLFCSHPADSWKGSHDVLVPPMHKCRTRHAFAG